MQAKEAASRPNYKQHIIKFKNHTVIVLIQAPQTPKPKLTQGHKLHSKWTQAIHLPTKYQLQCCAANPWHIYKAKVNATD